MDQEELYQNYQSKLGRLEEQREDLEYKKRRMEQRMAEQEQRCSEVSNRFEQLRARWGDNASMNELVGEYDNFLDEGARQRRQQEEELKQEYHQIKTEIRCCEEWYDEEKRSLGEEEGCPE